VHNSLDNPFLFLKITILFKEAMETIETVNVSQYYSPSNLDRLISLIKNMLCKFEDTKRGSQKRSHKLKEDIQWLN
jgi:hypothetical protein